MEPATPYVRGKYYYYRSRLDDARAVFASIPQSEPLLLPGALLPGDDRGQEGRPGRRATQGYDALLKMQAPDAASKDVQDLARLAIARILYERSQFDKAIEAYLSIPRQSKYWPEALREQAWTYIKAKDWQRAYRSVNLLLLADPDVPDGPDLRILEGNLQLRMSNFYLASDTFSKVRDEFEPIHRQLNQVIVRSQTDPAYFDTLIGKSLDKFDIGAFVPPTAAKWVQGRAGGGADDGARDRHGRHAARSGRQPEAARSHPARDGRPGAGRHLPGPRVAADEVDRDHEPAGRHPAEVRRQDPRRSSTRS